MTVTERLYMLLKEQGKTSSQLCRWLGIENNVIAGWKKKNDIPPSKYLVNICEFLGITVDYLLTGESTTKSEIENEAEAPFTERYIPPKNGLPEDERDILAMYTLMSEEGKRIAYFSLKGIVEGTTNLGYSRQYGAEHKSGKTA